jgi:hypothetical protein
MQGPSLSRHIPIRLGSASGWRRCVLLDQILTLQVPPEFSRNLRLHRGVVFQDLMFSADTDHQGCGNIRRGRKLQCGRSQIDPVIGRNVTQSLAFLNVGSGDFVGVLSVIVLGLPDMNPALSEDCVEDSINPLAVR